MKHLRLPLPQAIILLIYALITGLLIAYKYSHFLYTQLDLAIFANALRQPWSDLLFSTIQGHHYFGDHFMPYLVILKPFFDLFNQSSVFLLALQILMIVSVAWPLQKLLDIAIEKKYQLVFFTLFFLNPLTINIALYEFHPELLYVPLILWAVYFFTIKSYYKYLGTLLAILLIREDSLLAILPFTFLALIEKRGWKWLIAPLLSIPYFFTAIKIIGLFNTQGQSVFIKYYSWLGDSFLNIVINGITHPWLIIQHLSTIYVFEFVIGGLMLFLFLPLFAPRYLLIGLFSYLSLALGPGSDITIYHSHYSVIVLASLTCASIFGLQKFLKKYIQLADRHRIFWMPMAVILLISFHNTSLSPLPALITQLNDPAIQARVTSQQDALNHINLSLPTVASYQFLDRIKSSHVYFIGYAVQQLQQFKAAPYLLPETTIQSALDLNDLFNFGADGELEEYTPYETEFVQIMMRFPVQYSHNGLVVGHLNEQWQTRPSVEFKNSNIVSQNFRNIEYNFSGESLNINGTVKVPAEFHSPLFAKIESLDKAGKVIDVNYQNFGQGTFTTVNWQTGNEYDFMIETSTPSNSESFKLSLVTLQGGYILNSLGTSELVVDKEIEISSVLIK